MRRNRSIAAPARPGRALLKLLDLSAAVEDDPDFLAVLDRPERLDFPRAVLADLRVAGSLEFGQGLFLGQGVRARDDRTQDQRAKNASPYHRRYSLQPLIPKKPRRCRGFQVEFP